MQDKMNCILKLLQGCNTMQKLLKIHAQVILNGYQHHLSISNHLINFCAVSAAGSLPYATLLFHHTPFPHTSAWNSIIRAHSQTQSPLQSLFYYNQMISLPQHPDNFTFTFLLKACEKAKDVGNKCCEVHSSVVRRGFGEDVVVCTNLVRSYAANGLVPAAQRVFNEMPVRDLVSWNSMISCLCQAGLHQEALSVYDGMRISGVGVDEFTLVSLLSTCAHVGALDFGIRIHEFAYQNGFMDNVFVGNATIDMYAKCGSLDLAIQLFSVMPKKDISTWNSIVVGLGVHGRGDEAISFFQQMLHSGISPNHITFLGLLCGCSHQGLIEEGYKYFLMMKSDFGLQPGSKHYGCMVDLFGRAGQLDRALHIIQNSPSNDPVLWRTLLGGCKIHKNVEIGEIAMKKLVNLKGLGAGDCVLLAGIYADAKDTQGVSKMRKMIKAQGIKTTPGWSWIEVHNTVHRFVVDDKSHCDTKEIYLKLKDIIHRATVVGYVEENSSVSTCDFNEEYSGNFGSYHSEKLAIAFGLARTPEGTSLRIVKNLRVCRDCHSFTKFVSKAFHREIIVRDRVRFHHFKDGECSCKDYW